MLLGGGLIVWLSRPFQASVFQKMLDNGLRSNVVVPLWRSSGEKNYLQNSVVLCWMVRSEKKTTKNMNQQGDYCTVSIVFDCMTPINVPLVFDCSRDLNGFHRCFPYKPKKREN